MSENDCLDSFYDLINAGMEVRDFLNAYDDVYEFTKSTGLTEGVRLGKGRTKRLRDEVTPAKRFIVEFAAPTDKVQFPLDDGPMDCNIWHDFRHRKIQITVAQAKERLNLMTELNTTGETYGVLPVTDDRGKASFDQAMTQRGMYSNDDVQDGMIAAIELSISRKDDNLGADTLLIEMNLLSLRPERWEEIRPRLLGVAAASPFSEIYVVGFTDDGDYCMQIK